MGKLLIYVQHKRRCYLFLTPKRGLGSQIPILNHLLSFFCVIDHINEGEHLLMIPKRGFAVQTLSIYDVIYNRWELITQANSMLSSWTTSKQQIHSFVLYIWARVLCQYLCRYIYVWLFDGILFFLMNISIFYDFFKKSFILWWNMLLCVFPPSFYFISYLS